MNKKNHLIFVKIKIKYMKQTIIAILFATLAFTSCKKEEQQIIQVKVESINLNGGGIVNLSKPLSEKRNYLLSDVQEEDPSFNRSVGQKLNISRYFWNNRQYYP